MPSTVYKIEFDAEITRLEYVTDDDIAAREGGQLGQFQELELLEEIHRRGLGRTYVDCGAHIGNHSLFFAKHTHAEMVIAIEAHPTIFWHLRRNVLRNETATMIQCVPCALWSENKEGWVGDVVPGNSGRTQLGGDGRKFAKRRAHTVKCRTIDHVCQHLDVGLLKLDIEDCEVPAIQGALATLDRCHPLIIAEHHNARFFEEFAWQVEPLGYRCEPESYDPRGETRIWRHHS